MMRFARKGELTKNTHPCCVSVLSLLLLLLLTGCAAAAPAFDLSAGEIAAAEGLTLNMPAEALPAPWIAQEEPGKWNAALPYAGIAFDASARADEAGTLKQVTLSAGDDGSWTQEDVEALVQALNADYGIELVPVVANGTVSLYAFQRNCNEITVTWTAGVSVSLTFQAATPLLPLLQEAQAAMAGEEVQP